MKSIHDYIKQVISEGGAVKDGILSEAKVIHAIIPKGTTFFEDSAEVADPLTNMGIYTANRTLNVEAQLIREYTIHTKNEQIIEGLLRLFDGLRVTVDDQVDRPNMKKIKVVGEMVLWGWGTNRGVKIAKATDCQYDAPIGESAPPGMEDVVLALKKKYPNDEGRAFAIAWSMYNKKHGVKEDRVDTGKPKIVPGFYVIDSSDNVGAGPFQTPDEAKEHVTSPLEVVSHWNGQCWGDICDDEPELDSNRLKHLAGMK